jgi:hypothetical protein
MRTRTSFLFVFALIAASGQDNSYTTDGYAELPRAYFDTRLLVTPSPGPTVAIAAGGDVSAAYAAAVCGQTLTLAAGQTYKLPTALPPKGCLDTQWITIRSDGQLPAEGVRVTPAAKPQMATLLSTAGGNGVQLSVDHVRFTGIAFMKPVGSKMLSDFVNVTAGSSVIFDRVYMHGNPQEETTRGVLFGNVTRLAVIDSYFDEFHCLAGVGSCTDAQAIASLGGSQPTGIIKIVNNYLQASGENILFGGGAALQPVTDVEVRRNHFDKPLTWMDKTATPKPYIVKNDMELKNAQRVLVEGNVMTGSWGGFSQNGFAIVITPKNQAGVGPNNTKINLCSTCIVTDVTIRYNYIAHVGGGFAIANVLSDNGGAAADGQRYSIHDVVIDDIDGTKYKGAGELAEIATDLGAASPLLQNLTIDHVTAFPAAHLLIVGASATKPMKNINFTNNLVTAGQYPVWNMGGGTANCAYADVPVTTVAKCFNPGVFTGNVIATNLSSYGVAKWPPNNTVVTSVGFDATAYPGKGANAALVAQYTVGVN